MSPLRERIKSGRLFICQRHFTEDQILRHDTRVTLKPGVMPTLNLPVKSFPPSSSKPRESAGNIFEKKSLCNEARCETPTMCYKTFMEFLNRVSCSSLLDGKYQRLIKLLILSLMMEYILFQNMKFMLMNIFLL